LTAGELFFKIGLALGQGRRKNLKERRQNCDLATTQAWRRCIFVASVKIMFLKKTYNLSVGHIAAFIVTAGLLGGLLLWSGINLAWQNWPNWRQSGLNSLLPDLQKWFGKDNNQAANVTMQVVDEESQVVDVVAKASPAVVSIVASAEVPKFETYYSDPGIDLPPDLQQFFNFQIPQQRQNGTQKQEIGAGTGFLASSDGYIITNKHVVADEKAEYTVYLNDDKHLGEKITAKVLARDPGNDLAILKIDKTDLPFLTFGDSAKLKVGQTAITIGYALGEFDNTVSKGVVSGLSRSITAASGQGQERLTNLIQTDAAINPGNSGGPMLNLAGQVIGVNVAMANGQNIGFALPAASAQEAYDQVKNTGTIKAKDVAFLGVRYLPITDNLQSQNNLPFDYGVLVTRGDTNQDLAVMPGSPADKAGLVENDIILEADGQKITLKNQLSDIIATRRPGDRIKLKIYHKGQIKAVVLTFEKK